MIKPIEPFRRVSIAGLLPLLLTFFNLYSFAQHTSVSPFPGFDCRIDQVGIQERKISIECAVSNVEAGRWALRFRDQFAGVDRLSERIFQLKVRDEKGTALPLEIRGEFKPITAEERTQLTGQH